MTTADSVQILQTETIAPALDNASHPAASWQEVLEAYHQAWYAIDEVDDHHTAFLALHVVRNTVQMYASHLKTRSAKEGDLANLSNLKNRIDLSYADHAGFTDVPHVDYAVLRRTVLSELQYLREDTARRAATHAIVLASEGFPPLSYSSAIDEMENIESAVALIEGYRDLNPLFMHAFDLKYLARTMSIIAEQEKQGFPDYKDERFATLFEAITVRIGHLHLAYNKPSI